MSRWRNIPLARADRYAQQFVQLIQPACSVVEIAGEVRRRQDVTSQPIEVVAVPILTETRDMFGELREVRNLLREALERLVKAERVEERIERVRGSRRVRNELPTKLLFRADSGMLCPVDLWETSAGKFGAVLALRTGPYGLRSGLMAPERSVSVSGRAGLLPRAFLLSEQDGLVRREGGEVETPTEESFFTALDLPLVVPERRQ